jgi:predicted RNA-binding Zn-ribbon protein involved in translation (DUF1610 family)
MTIKGEKQSTSQSLRKTRTFGKIRCHNPSCMERIVPESGADHAKCPTCGMEYRLFWVNDNLPRIRGPVWDVNREIAQRTFAERQAAASKKTKKGRK